MKKRNDGEIQKSLEESGTDSEMYGHLFEALSRQPAKGLPYDFSARVLCKVQAETLQNSELRSFLLLIAIVSAVIAAIYGLFVLFQAQLGRGFAAIVAAYKWLFVLAILCLLTIQYLDQVLIKSTIFKRRQH